MNKAYEQEIEMWNQVFKECTPVDLRKLDLKVETMFDEALKLFNDDNYYQKILIMIIGIGYKLK